MVTLETEIIGIYFLMRVAREKARATLCAALVNGA
jgi:hypothetical protein